MNKAQTSVFCWPAIERMQQMHQLIQNGEYPNCTTMAREFEMSVRTLKRNIDFMKTRMNLPIGFDVRRNGYYYSSAVPEVPKVPMSEADVFTMFVAKKAIEQYHGTPLQKMLEATFRKIMGQLDQSARFILGDMEGALSFRPFAPGDAELKDFEVLMRGVTEHRAVRFMYRNRGQVRAQARQVHPYHIGYVDNHWSLFGFDVSRKAMRTFVLTRLSQPELTKKKFTVSQKFDLNKYLAGSLGLYRGEEDIEVVVELDAWAADDVRGRRLHSSQELIELGEGRLRVKLRLNSLEEVERWVLGFGAHARVVGPDGLRERVERTAKEIARVHARQSS